jgi:hypothetical protein|tara:strand:+ start:4450 stop:4641 length:192 start_codon:yes stop_codon:yes gene_type:complete
MIGKEVRAWCSKEMKNLSVVVFGGKERNFPKFHISSASSLDTHDDENVPPTNFLVVVFNVQYE